MNEISYGDLTVKIINNPDKIEIKWIGKSTEKDPSSILDPFFSELMSGLGKNNIMEIDFSALDYMNSSTIPSIIKLIKELNNKKIKTNIKYNINSEWQNTTFKSFNSISQMLEYINVAGK